LEKRLFQLFQKEELFSFGVRCRLNINPLPWRAAASRIVGESHHQRKILLAMLGLQPVSAGFSFLAQ
jgi:hypothetical protein